MTTRGKSKKKTEGTDEEEMEMIEKMIEEDAQEDQPENPTQPELEIEVIVGNQPEKPIPVSYTHLDVYKRQVCRLGIQ